MKKVIYSLYLYMIYFVQYFHLNGVDHIVAVEAGPQFVDGGSVHIFQSAEEPSVQIAPIVLQPKQVKTLDKLKELINDLIHLGGWREGEM